MKVRFKCNPRTVNDVVLGLAKSGIPVYVEEEADQMIRAGNTYIVANFPSPFSELDGFDDEYQDGDDVEPEINVT